MTAAGNWRIEFMRAHPRLFEVMQEEPKLSFGYPLCRKGWRDVLERMCGRIEDALQENETFEFVRIKQKLGALRVGCYFEGSNDTEAKIVHAIELAEARSACTCESCGAEGRRYVSHGWLTTACAAHAKGTLVPEAPGWGNVHLLRRTPAASDVYYARYDREGDRFVEIAPPPSGSEE